MVTCEKSVNQSEKGTNSIFKCCGARCWTKSTRAAVSFSQDKCKWWLSSFVRADTLYNMTTVHNRNMPAPAHTSLECEPSSEPPGSSNNSKKNWLYWNWVTRIKKGQTLQRREQKRYKTNRNCECFEKRHREEDCWRRFEDKKKNQKNPCILIPAVFCKLPHTWPSK